MSGLYRIDATDAPIFLIGRDPDCHLVIRDPSVSRRHARIVRENAQWVIEDLHSKTGTQVNQKSISKEILYGGELLRIGLQHIHVLCYDDRLELCHLRASERRVEIAIQPDHAHTLGNSPQADIRVAHPRCPQKLAILRADHAHSQLHIQSLYRALTVDSALKLRPGEYWSLPWGILSWNGTHAIWEPTPPGLPIHIQDLHVSRGNRRLLQEINFNLRPGELLCVIGLSGQGKSSLLRCLAGHWEPESGEIRIAGLPATHPRLYPHISWLKQETPLRHYLTVRETLTHQASLCLSGDIPGSEITQLIEENLRLTGIQAPADQTIGSLSGGERRRVALAAELLTKPGLMLLDEPLAGLDPVNAHNQTNRLRQISWLGHTLVMTTHDLTPFLSADQILVLHQGYQAFCGSPDQALKFFNAATPQDILIKLPEHSGKEWNELFRRTHADNPAPLLTSSAKPKSFSQCAFKRTFFVTWDRFWKSLWRDKGRLYTVILQPITISALFTFLFSPDSSGWVAAFALTMATLWFALSSGIREIVQEKERLCPELRNGMSIPAYCIAKISALFLLNLPQILLCTTTISLTINLLPSWSAILPALSSATLAASSLGLATSAISRSTGQANALIPIILIPQLMFAGAMVPVDQMPTPGAFVSYLTISRYLQSALQKAFTLSPVSPPDWLIPILMAVVFVIIISIALYRLRRVYP